MLTYTPSHTHTPNMHKTTAQDSVGGWQDLCSCWVGVKEVASVSEIAETSFFLLYFFFYLTFIILLASGCTFWMPVNWLWGFVSGGKCCTTPGVWCEIWCDLFQLSYSLPMRRKCDKVARLVIQSVYLFLKKKKEYPTRLTWNLTWITFVSRDRGNIILVSPKVYAISLTII